MFFFFDYETSWFPAAEYVIRTFSLRATMPLDTS